MICIHNKDLRSEINAAVSKGLDFLHKSQLPYGEFKTYVFPDKMMTGQGRYVSTTYITTFVLYSLGFIDEPRVREMTQKAIAFFLQEMEGQGIWRYFGVNRSVIISGGTLTKYTPINTVPDLDVIACVSYFLKMNGVSFPDNLKSLLSNMSNDGVFLTWLLDYPMRSEFDEKTVFLHVRKNDKCCGVLSNILLYMGENRYTKLTVDYLSIIVEEGREEENIPYFPNKYVLYYLISRAFYNGVASLGKVKDIILHRIREDVVQSGFQTALTAGYMICTFLNFGAFDTLLHEAVEYLLKTQGQEGSWQRERFCDEPVRCYGSEELTTAICIEALARYERRDLVEA
ncbi:MAG: hypothetical protein N3I35_01240 [Clostridia bacterium]|nr:hypothetical protein [Clostridia bacterium]